MLKPDRRKKNVTIKLYPELISRIEKVMKIGYKKNFIIEKGIELHLDKIEKEQKIINEAQV